MISSVVMMTHLSILHCCCVVHINFYKLHFLKKFEEPSMKAFNHCHLYLLSVFISLICHLETEKPFQPCFQIDCLFKRSSLNHPCHRIIGLKTPAFYKFQEFQNFLLATFVDSLRTYLY